MTAPVTRRGLLAGAGAAAALAASACTRGETGGAGGRSEELATIDHLAGLERLTVETYTTLRDLAVTGRLGALIPPAVVEFVSTATGRHQEHLDGWNQMLVAAGHDEVTAADLRFKPRVEAAVGRLVDIPGLLALALRIEDHTAQSYLQALPALTTPEAIRTAGQIVVVDEQHQAYLRYVLGLSPVGSGTERDARDLAPADPQASLSTW